MSGLRFLLASARGEGLWYQRKNRRTPNAGIIAFGTRYQLADPRLYEKLGTEQAVADLLGVTRQMANYRIRLAELPEFIRNGATKGFWNERQLRELLRVQPGCTFIVQDDIYGYILTRARGKLSRRREKSTRVDFRHHRTRAVTPFSRCAYKMIPINKTCQNTPISHQERF